MPFKAFQFETTQSLPLPLFSLAATDGNPFLTAFSPQSHVRSIFNAPARAVSSHTWKTAKRPARRPAAARRPRRNHRGAPKSEDDSLLVIQPLAYTQRFESKDFMDQTNRVQPNERLPQTF